MRSRWPILIGWMVFFMILVLIVCAFGHARWMAGYREGLDTHPIRGLNTEPIGCSQGDIQMQDGIKRHVYICIMAEKTK